MDIIRVQEIEKVQTMKLDSTSEWMDAPNFDGDDHDLFEDMYPTEPYYFIDKKLKNVIASEDERHKPETYLNMITEPSQRSIEDAKAAIEKSVDRDIGLCRKERLRLQKDLSTSKKKKKTVKQINVLKKNIEQLTAKLLMLDWEKNWLPIFHPYDSIVALRVESINDTNDPDGYKLYACVKQPNGTFLQKLIDEHWVRTNFEKEFIDKLIARHKEKGIMFFNTTQQKFQIIADPSNNQLNDLINRLPKIYEYKPTSNDDQILYIKCVTTYNQYTEIDVESTGQQKWYIMTKNNSLSQTTTTPNANPLECLPNGKRKHNSSYNPITELLLRSAIGVELFKAILLSTTIIMTEELKKPGSLCTNPIIKLDRVNGKFIVEFDKTTTRFIDEGDRKNGSSIFKKDQCGKSGFKQIYYYNLLDYKSKYYINVSRQQISGLLYNDVIDKWFGLERTTKDRKVAHNKVELDTNWVNSNFDGLLLDAIKEKSKVDNNKFQIVPIGLSRPLMSPDHIQCNPITHFLQGDEDTCIFTSMCNLLHHKNYCNLALHLDEYKTYFMEHLFLKYYKGMIGMVTAFLQQRSQFTKEIDERLKFTKKYQPNRIKFTPSFNLLFEATQNPNNIYHVTLVGEDGSVNHAVAITDNWIFDGNFSNALKLSQESLNETIMSTFQTVHSGFIWVEKNFKQKKEKW